VRSLLSRASSPEAGVSCSGRARASRRPGAGGGVADGGSMTDSRRYDLYGDASKRDPNATFAAMCREAPLQRQAGLDGTTPIWYVTRSADVDAMLRDERLETRRWHGGRCWPAFRRCASPCRRRSCSGASCPGSGPWSHCRSRGRPERRRAASDPLIRQRIGERSGDAEVVIEQPQQQRTGVTAAARPIETRHQRFHELVTEYDFSGRASLAHQKVASA
jgi:hypothetical protein